MSYLAHLAVIAADNDRTWFNSPAIQQQLGSAVKETLLMVSTSALVSIVIGLLLGVILTATRPHGLLPNRPVNQVLGLAVNLGRAIPFIILMFWMIPVTRFIVQTSSGWRGAAVPLAVSAIPYFARLVESNLSGVESGKVEAALMMGASRMRILGGVLVREAMPALIQSVTILIITLIGYSAMAGSIGGGGLGSLAVNQGYYNSNVDVVTIVVIVIVAIVAIVQMCGDMLSRLVDHR
ncbi:MULTISPECIES: methionine ABC transporter permease [unclassified Actinobaculum]|uniref:methionine ABC transporter permease n=1 Tax=unclassified Actinobaculum TaxID=2609299 RepID=UPI000D525929|nr:MULTISPECIES: methionine ABC transporter permease [unclassified Actinobaculum]AWE42271.1 metal ABC transporter permease [Actinobaculum sp. 313]RTE50839.1 ABC transporter permease [Actinobaculum sp. 352]